jgi:hypothetical protein
MLEKIFYERTVIRFMKIEYNQKHECLISKQMIVKTGEIRQCNIVVSSSGKYVCSNVDILASVFAAVSSRHRVLLN